MRLSIYSYLYPIKRHKRCRKLTNVCTEVIWAKDNAIQVVDTLLGELSGLTQNVPHVHQSLCTLHVYDQVGTVVFSANVYSWAQLICELGENCLISAHFIITCDVMTVYVTLNSWSTCSILLEKLVQNVGMNVAEARLTRGLHAVTVNTMILLLFVGCLTSQQHASVSQGWICSDNFTCCHTEIEVADQTFHLIQSQYTDTEPTSPSTDPVTPGTWQGSHWSANF